MTDTDLAPLPAHIWSVAAAALQIAGSDRLEAIDVALDLIDLADDLEPIVGAIVFRGRIQGVRRVKDDKETRNPGKAEITFINEKGELETIETGWLWEHQSRHMANLAQRSKDRQATFWKNNDPGRNPTHAQGYRRLVWLRVDPEEATPS